MKTLAPGYGKQVSELVCDLQEFDPVVLRELDTAELDRRRKAVDDTAYRFRVAERRLSIVEVDLRRLEEELHGYERALEMVAVAEHPSDAVAKRLEQKIEQRVDEVVELSAEVAYLRERMRTLRVDLRGVHAAAIEALESAITDAEDLKRHQMTQQRRQEIQATRALDPTDESPMWSPVAIDAYRVWDMRSGGMFGSWKQWTSSDYRATCSRGEGVPHTDGRCGLVAFGCGVYAAKDPVQLMESYGLKPTTTFAIGLVSLDGRVIEHHEGYRAEHVQAVALITVDSDEIRLIEAPDDLESVYEDPDSRHELGTVIDVGRTTAIEFRRSISRELKKRTQGGSPWT